MLGFRGLYPVTEDPHVESVIAPICLARSGGGPRAMWSGTLRVRTGEDVLHSCGFVAGKCITVDTLCFIYRVLGLGASLLCSNWLICADVWQEWQELQKSGMIP